MFDTIRLETPLVCPGCGREEPTVQTHLFGETLDTYRIGMIVPHCPVLTGILIETFWCSACHNVGMEASPSLYVVIWHSVLVSIEWKREEAERKLAAVDRLDLIEWLDRMQRESATWRRNYHALRSDLSRWHEYQGQQKAAPVPIATSRLSSFFLPDEAIRNAADPLAAILERHPPVQDPGGLF
jgi:hypothetical protein